LIGDEAVFGSTGPLTYKQRHHSTGPVQTTLRTNNIY
jgi:hypothetical protein